MISRRLQMGRDIIENIVCENVDFVDRKNNMDKFKFSSFVRKILTELVKVEETA